MARYVPLWKLYTGESSEPLPLNLDLAEGGVSACFFSVEPALKTCVKHLGLCPSTVSNQATADVLLSLSSRLKCVGGHVGGEARDSLCHLEQGGWLRKHPAPEQQWALGEQSEP